MATVTVEQWTPFGVALTLTAISGKVTRTSATTFTVILTVAWETYWDDAKTNYGMTATSGGKTVTINTFGVKASRGDGTLTGTYSISGNGSATKSISVTFRNYNSDNGDSKTISRSLSVNVPAWTSYAVTYNANGGSGAPSSQTKWKDQTLTLSKTAPTKTGYIFEGWSTTKQTATTGNLTVNYTPGASYTANASATLYAVWRAKTYTVDYVDEPGTGGPNPQYKSHGIALTLSTTKPTRANYTFKGWGTSRNATTAAYQPGGSYTSNANITLYAIWELSYTKPRITNFSVARCDSDFTVTDKGTYVKVKFTWATDKTVSNITIYVLSASGDIVATSEPTASGTSGTITRATGSGSLSTEQSYTVRVEVRDSDGSTSKYLTLPGIKYAIDFKSGGKGVAFGKPAESDNYVDFGFDTVFDNNLAIAGRDPSGNIKEAFQPQNSNGNTVIGWGNYDSKSGSTNIYGHDVLIGVGNTDNPGTYRPYIRKGDSFDVTVHTAGYLTNSGTYVKFFVPLTRPIVGSPGLSVTSNKGIILRQNGVYTHGSSSETYILPSGYTPAYKYTQGVWVTAIITGLANTDATNNDSIGIEWSGILTFT